MGKGFSAADGILGADLSGLIESAGAAHGLNIRVQAIVNDSAATLLSRAYVDSSTRLALILGTGVNAAIYLPVAALGRSKFGRRPSVWYREATHVVVNTEMSMFGKYVFPTTRWDEHLNATHVLPDFQPFEHLVSGRYLGEIFRLVLVEGVQTAGLFGGQLPQGMSTPYGLDTGVMAAVEGDESPDLSGARHALTSAFEFGHTAPTLADLALAKHVAQSISRRAAAYLAVGIHALWSLREATDSATSSPVEGSSPVLGASNRLVVNGTRRSGSPAPPGEEHDHVSIGCNGSVFEKYPHFAATAQSYVDDLCTAAEFGRRLVLERAIESALFGAAVAVGIADRHEAEQRAAVASVLAPAPAPAATAAPAPTAEKTKSTVGVSVLHPTTALVK